MEDAIEISMDDVDPDIEAQLRAHAAHFILQSTISF